MTRKKPVGYIFVITAFLAVLFAAPLLMLLVHSLLSPGTIQTTLASGDVFGILSAPLSLGQYYELLVENYPFMRHFWLSLLYAVCTTGITLVTSIPAAFLFSKLKWRGRDTVFFVYIVLMMMPYQVLMVPLYKQFSDMNMLDNPLAVMLPAAFQPFWVFMLRQYAKSIPDSLLDAMRLETDSVFKCLRHLAIPMLGDCIVALGVLSFADSWNLFEPALVMLQTKEILPLPIILSRLMEVDISIVFASSIVYLLPAAVLFVGAKEKLAQGVEVMKW